MHEVEAIHDRRLAVAGDLRPRERPRCEAPGCEARTSDRKPYCLAHIACMPYVHDHAVANGAGGERRAACSRSPGGGP